MSAQEKDRTGWHRAALDTTNVSQHSTPPHRHKWQRITASFLSGRRWHAIDAVRELHTTCLHTDIAGLESRGLHFHRERITVAGYGGEKASVVSYTLLPESYPLARHLLGMATPSGQPLGDAASAYRRASGG